MKISKTLATLLGISLLLSPSAARSNDGDFGDADFSADIETGGPKSYHDAWCREIKNKCRVRFAGRSLSVEGQGSIDRSQLSAIRRDEDGEEYYYYIRYRSRAGKTRTALFLFAHKEASRNFLKALYRWQSLDAKPYPNFRLPASQGPQETHGRDEGNNPYTP